MCGPMQQQPDCLFFTKKRSFSNAKFMIFITVESCDKTYYKIEKTCNHFHNILRVFNVLPIFPSTTSRAMGDYYL